MDNPVGDPFGGPAYGERAMPVVAVVAAGMGIATGVGMVAAAGGLAAMSIGSAIVAGSLIAGGALTIVGTVTGNQKLTKIGGTLSLIGGVGAMAQGAIQGWQGAADKGINTVTGSLAEAAKGAVTYPGEMMAKGMGTISDSFGGFFGGEKANLSASATQPPASDSMASVASSTGGGGGTAPTGAGVDSFKVDYSIASKGPTVALPIDGANQYQLNTGLAGQAPLGGVNAEALGMTKQQFAQYQALGGGTDAFKAVIGTGAQTGWTMGEKMMTASMAMQGAGAIMTSQAQEAAAKQAQETAEQHQARVDSIVRVATTKEEFDRFNATGVAAVYLPPVTPTFAARPAIAAPTANAPTWNVAPIQQPVVAAVRGAVAPTFQVPNRA
jgi:hypothetical protein